MKYQIVAQVLLLAADAGTTSTTTSTTPIVNDRPTLFGIADAHEDLQFLRDLYLKTGLKFKMEQSRDATILMPANEAFVHAENITRLSYPTLVEIFNYHNLPEVHKFGELDEGVHEFETVEGSHIVVKVGKHNGVPEFIINDKAKVIGDHFDTVNGVAYIISEILIPSTLEATIEEELKEAPEDFHTFLNHLNVPDHVKIQSRENDRYDDTPASRIKVKEPLDEGDSEQKVGLIQTPHKKEGEHEKKVTPEDEKKVVTPAVESERRRRAQQTSTAALPTTSRGHSPELKATNQRQQRDGLFKPARARSVAGEKTFRVANRAPNKGSVLKAATIQDVERAKHLGLLV